MKSLNNLHNRPYTQSVSYTHLDVYKRQAISNKTFIMSWDCVWCHVEWFVEEFKICYVMANVHGFDKIVFPTVTEITYDAFNKLQVVQWNINCPTRDIITGLLFDQMLIQYMFIILVNCWHQSHWCQVVVAIY